MRHRPYLLTPSPVSGLSVRPRGGTTRSVGAVRDPTPRTPPPPTPNTPPPWRSASPDLDDAELDTLDILGWTDLLSHVATFTSTHAGRTAVLALAPAPTLHDAQAALAITAALDALEVYHGTSLDFGGATTTGVARTIRNAEAGGTPDGPDLLAVASVLSCVQRLVKLVGPAVRRIRTEAGAQSRTYAVVAPLEDLLAPIDPCPALVDLIRAQLDEKGAVREGASAATKAAHAALRTVQARARAVVASGGGELSEYGGRWCLSMPADRAASRSGLVLGVSSAGGHVYFEPSAAVAHNNKLAEARETLRDAEEEVRFALAGQLAGKGREARAAFDLLVHLDLCVARARFGRWMQCARPELVDMTTGFAAQSASAKARKGSRNNGEKEGWRGDLSSAVAPYLSLRNVRHPLLAARRQRWAEQQRAELGPGMGVVGSTPDPNPGANTGNTATVTDTSPDDMFTSTAASLPPRAPRRRTSLLDRLRDEGRARGGTSVGAGDDTATPTSSVSSVSSTVEAMVPVDPVPFSAELRAPIRAVIITGPNTGGKTATLKTVGLVACMARAGLFVPAAEPVILPWFDAVLADVGDTQVTPNVGTPSMRTHLRKRLDLPHGSFDRHAMYYAPTPSRLHPSSRI